MDGDTSDHWQPVAVTSGDSINNLATTHTRTHTRTYTRTHTNPEQEAEGCGEMRSVLLLAHLLQLVCVTGE